MKGILFVVRLGNILSASCRAGHPVYVHVEGDLYAGEDERGGCFGKCRKHARREKTVASKKSSRRRRRRRGRALGDRGQKTNRGNDNIKKKKVRERERERHAKGWNWIELYGTLIRELGRNWHALTAGKLKYTSATLEGRCVVRGNPAEIPCRDESWNSKEGIFYERDRHAVAMGRETPGNTGRLNEDRWEMVST